MFQMGGLKPPTKKIPLSINAQMLDLLSFLQQIGGIFGPRPPWVIESAQARVTGKGFWTSASGCGRIFKVQNFSCGFLAVVSFIVVSKSLKLYEQFKRGSNCSEVVPGDRYTWIVFQLVIFVDFFF